ncbi:MAG: nitroreductase family protein [Sulfurospirillaceae bacterium]|nr:nitroreductase family protein [Sulfurospirillaceae bacterium]
MNLSEAIYQRRSVREFLPKKVEPQKIEILFKTAMQAPSAGNQQPWEFLVVTCKEKLQALAKAHPYATPLENAPLGIIVLCNENGLRFPEYWQQDLAAATQNILLQCVELDLGAVWTGIAPDTSRMEYIEKLFALPQNIKAFALLAVGYPLYPQKEERRFKANRVHYEEYKKASF